MNSPSSSGIPAFAPGGAGLTDAGARLPDGYGTTLIVLLPRDPHWMFAYWEIADRTAAELKARHGDDLFRRSRAVLRMHETAASGQSLREPLDVEITLEARNWYLRSDRPSTAWFVEMGLRTPDGRFILIARSNRVRLPESSVSDLLDEKWVAVRKDLERVLEASGGGKLGLGSLELTKTLERRWALLQQVSSWKGSGGISSFGKPAPEQAARGFWLAADCELVLYGATEPGATLTVAGRPVELLPDGTFSLRFALPPGTVELPVRAIAGDRRQVRSVTISVKRQA